MMLAKKMSTTSVHDNSSEISYSRKKDQVEVKVRLEDQLILNSTACWTGWFCSILQTYTLPILYFADHFLPTNKVQIWDVFLFLAMSNAKFKLFLFLGR